MKTIDFKHFKMFTGIDHARSIVTDITRDFADYIYREANGVMAHDLALRIYKSDGDVQLNAEELNFLTTFAKNGTPIFADSFEANIKDDTEDGKQED